MNSFNRDFKRTERFVKGAMVVQFTIMVVVVIAVIVGIVALINNPESVGEFFGKIVNGFNSAK